MREQILSIIEKNPKKIKSRDENDPKRFIDNIPTTETGEVALNNNYFINQDKIYIQTKPFKGLSKVEWNTGGMCYV